MEYEQFPCPNGTLKIYVITTNLRPAYDNSSTMQDRLINKVEVVNKAK